MHPAISSLGAKPRTLFGSQLSSARVTPACGGGGCICRHKPAKSSSHKQTCLLAHLLTHSLTRSLTSTCTLKSMPSGSRFNTRQGDDELGKKNFSARYIIHRAKSCAGPRELCPGWLGDVCQVVWRMFAVAACAGYSLNASWRRVQTTRTSEQEKVYERKFTARQNTKLYALFWLTVSDCWSREMFKL